MAVCYIYRHVNWMDIGDLAGRGKRETREKPKKKESE